MTREEFRAALASGEYDTGTLLVVACEQRLPVRATTKDGAVSEGYVRLLAEDGWVYLSPRPTGSTEDFDSVRDRDVVTVEAL